MGKQLRRFPLSPLLEAARFNDVKLEREWSGPKRTRRTDAQIAFADRLNLEGKTVSTWHQFGIPAYDADRVAIGLGFHPWEIWPDW